MTAEEIDGAQVQQQLRVRAGVPFDIVPQGAAVGSVDITGDGDLGAQRVATVNGENGCTALLGGFC